MLEAGVVASVLAFQGLAALPVVVAQFVVNDAMFPLFQLLPDGRSLLMSSLEAMMVVTVRAEARLYVAARRDYARMVAKTKG